MKCCLHQKNREEGEDPHNRCESSKRRWSTVNYQTWDIEVQNSLGVIVMKVMNLLRSALIEELQTLAGARYTGC